MEKGSERFGRPATKGRSNPTDKASSRATGKLSSLTSSATDEDFYSSLAQMAGDDDEDDDEDSMTEVDAKNLASSLADIDDLDSDLFGNSLGRKSTPKPSSNVAAKNTAQQTENSKLATQEEKSFDGKTKKDHSTSKSETQTKPGKKFDIDKYDSMDFDEDDPLAGLLSDDEDDGFGSKSKKTNKKKPFKKKPAQTEESNPIERPKTSRSREDSKDEAPLFSSKTQKSKENENTGENLTPSVGKDGALSPRVRSPAKVKSEISFDSGDDLPGMDNSPRTNPVPKESPKKPPKEKTKKIDNDLFGDEDGLLGLDEGKQSTPLTIKKQTITSRFDELLGGKKEQTETTKSPKPKTIDDFLSNISSTKSPSSQSNAKKAQSPKEDDFSFGGYTPSAVASPGRSRARPDTAPGSRRTVRFADDLGLGDDLFGTEGRPATAPSIRDSTPQRRPSGVDDKRKAQRLSVETKALKNGLFEQEKKSPVPGREIGGGSGGADWLGLGSEDTGLELELPTYKPPTPNKQPSRRTEPQQTVSPQQPASALPRRHQVSADGDDFLKMLGIALDDKPSQQNESIDGIERKERRWRDKTPEKDQEALDFSSSDVQQKSQESIGGNRSTDTKEISRPFIEGLKSQQASRLQAERSQNVDAQSEHISLTRGSDGQKELSKLQKTEEKSHVLADDKPPKQQLRVSQTNQDSAPVYSSVSPPQPPLTSTPQPHSDLTIKALSSNAMTQNHIYHSTPVSSQSNQSLHQKAQLESEVQSLMRRLYDMESNAQKQELDTTAYVTQLEAKVCRLQLENEHIQSNLEAQKQRHLTEIANIGTSHKAHIKTLEKSYHLRESRIKEETELQATHFDNRIRALEDEKTALKTSHTRKIQSLDSTHASEVKRLKELHQQAIEELRAENEEEMQRLRRLKEQEVSAVSSARGHAKSLQSLMQQVLNSTKDVSDMKSHIEATHKSSLTERELVAKARDDYLTQLQDRLVKQQAENDEERARLQGLIAKMEINIREQNRQVDQERWKLCQDESRIKALQISIEEERRITMEQLASDRADVQRARDDLLREQKRVTTELQEERRSLAMERTQLSSTHREIINRQTHKSNSAMQVEAEMEVTASKIKQDAAALDARQAHLTEKEANLCRDKREFEQLVEDFEKEKARIGKLSIEVQRRSEEIGELCSEGAKAREEGEEALLQAQRLRQDTEDERVELENRLIILREKEKQIAEDRVAIAHERRLLEMDKRNNRCRQCNENNYNHLTEVSPAPALTTQDLNSSVSPRPKAPDILLNSLELKRNFRKWDSDKEKDEEFLEKEARFLSGLRKIRVDPLRGLPFAGTTTLG